MSSLIVGSRMVTAEVFALTTKVEMHAAASTPPAAARPLSIAGTAALTAWTRGAGGDRRHGVAGGTGGAGVWPPKKR